jgi:hypothetical protein
MNNLTKVDRWRVLADYLVDGTVIRKGTQGINYLDDFKRYVFITERDTEYAIDLDILIQDKEHFQPVGDVAEASLD